MVHETTVKVRICETDALGHVSNISYYIYLEEGRVEFFKSLNRINSNNFPFILASATCDFISQCYFDQQLKVQTSVSSIGNTSFQLEQNIIDFEANLLIAKSKSTLVHFNFEKQKSEPLPQELRNGLEKHVQ